MKYNIQNLTLTALMAAIICITGPIVIPIGVVPMSFTNMAIYLNVLLLDKKKATISVAVYLLIGLVGLPVFSGFTGGAGKLFGPTGGYLIGYLALSWVAGVVQEQIRKFGNRKKEIEYSAEREPVEKKISNRTKAVGQMIALAIGTLSLYFLGTLWLMYQSNLTFVSALSIGVLPFIPFDMIKIVVAALLGKSIKERIV